MHIFKPFALCLALCACGAAPACETIPLLAPARRATLDQRQPVFRWSGDPSASYRVQVAATVPEARVALALDTHVLGNHFQLPSALPMARAAVKVLVSKGCPQLDAQDLQAQGAWFFVDVRPSCALADLSVAHSGERLTWDSVGGASAYAVRVFGPAPIGEARLVPLLQDEVTAPTWALPRALRTVPGPEGPRVVTVQALCAGQAGRPVAMVLRPGG